MMRPVMFIGLLAVCSAQYNYNPQVTVQTNTHHSFSNSHAESNHDVNYTPADLTRPFQPIAEEYNKEFYSYTAPEPNHSDHHIDHYLSNVLKKNLRVIFIRNPENNALERTALKLAQAGLKDRTAIYVLNKQPDLNGFVNKLHSVAENHKPEVHFVNYQTPGGAEHAEQNIQAHYAQLPGTTTTHISSGQQHNYVSTGSYESTSHHTDAALNHAAASSQSFASSPAKTYLPPLKH